VHFSGSGARHNRQPTHLSYSLCTFLTSLRRRRQPEGDWRGAEGLPCPGNLQVVLILTVYFAHSPPSTDANQKTIGEGLKDFLAQGKRDQLFITSKIWNDEHRPADVR